MLFRSENIPFHKDIPLTMDGNYPLSIEAMVYESYLQSASLRDDIPELTHSHQLELILASAKRNNVYEWGKLFAIKHELDYNKIHAIAKQRRKPSRVGLIKVRILNAINLYCLGSDKLQIIDIYEASIVAARIEKNPPNIFKIIYSIVWRILNKIIN